MQRTSDFIDKCVEISIRDNLLKFSWSVQTLFRRYVHYILYTHLYSSINVIEIVFNKSQDEISIILNLLKCGRLALVVFRQCCYRHFDFLMSPRKVTDFTEISVNLQTGNL